jgi:hypothetical protein
MLGGVAFDLGKQTSVRRMEVLKILSLFALNDCVDTCFHLVNLPVSRVVKAK